jgi:aminodeoxyfutalosine deaminase
MQYLSADCIIPVTGEPCYNSVLLITDKGKIEGIFPKEEINKTNSEIQYFNGILCPGFINTHCHLELSWAKGLIAEHTGLDNFVRQLEKIRNTVSESNIQQAIELEAVKMGKLGIIATADISNGPSSFGFKKTSNHYFHTFIEVFGSDPSFAEIIFEKANQLRAQFAAHVGNTVSITAHATYSLSPELFRLIANSAKGELLSIHHQENADENYFFEKGTGRIAARRNLFNPKIQPFTGTGKRPLASISEYFNHNQRILLVHNTVSEKQDIEFAKDYFNQVFWCLCPNANLFIENKLPDVNLFQSNDCKITLGTDSLASNHQLSILEEMKTIQFHFPEIQLPKIIRWGTLNGAEFLGIDERSGSFEKGKLPGVVLIENADTKTLKLKPESTSRLIIPARL